MAAILHRLLDCFHGNGSIPDDERNYRESLIREPTSQWKARRQSHDRG